MPAPVSRDWYDTPLYYDIIFDEDTVKEADFLETMVRRHGLPRSRSVLELACGSGRHVAEFARRGWRSAGFDLNAEMLGFAKDRLVEAGLKATIWQDRMEAFVVPGQRRFDLIHCLVSTFKYLLTEADARACLVRTAEVLKPGGLFVLGVHLTDPANEKPSHERWTATRDGVEVICNTRTWPPRPGTRLEPMRSRLKVLRRGHPPYLQETNWEVRSYTAVQLRALLRSVPALEPVVFHDFRHDPGETRRFDDAYSDIVLVLRRR